MVILDHSKSHLRVNKFTDFEVTQLQVTAIPTSLKSVFYILTLGERLLLCGVQPGGEWSETKLPLCQKHN